MSKNYTIAVDFDGVLHQYKTPWINAHTIPDPPVDGAIEWLAQMAQKFVVVIHTTRGRTFRGRRAVHAWLKYWADGLYYPSPDSCGLDDIKVTHKKPAALIYLDDRAYRFEGSFPTADEIHAARPWNKPKTVLQ